MSDTTTNPNIGNCNACNGTVAKTAKQCPHCGQKKPFKKIPKKTTGKQMIAYIAVGFVLLSPIVFTEPSAPPSSAPSSDIKQGIIACEQAIRGSVNNPSTVSLDRFSGFGTEVMGDGSRRIRQGFSAKNSFGLEKKYDALCTIKPTGALDVKIVEQGR